MTEIYRPETKIAQAFEPMIQIIEDGLMERFRKLFEKYQELENNWIEENFDEDKPYIPGRSYPGFFNLVRANGLVIGNRYSTTAENSAEFSRSGSRRDVFNESFALKEAKYQAANIYNGFIAKFTNKVGDLDDVEVKFAHGGDCVITGKANGKRVTINQQTVWKVSKLYTPFCAFPARIYVNEQFVAAKNYKEMVEA